MTSDYGTLGFAQLPDVLDPAEVARWRPCLVETAVQLPNTGKEGEIAAVFPAADARVASILASSALGSLAAAALGTGEIRLIAAAAYLKPPGAPATFWHQDLWFFPIAGAPMTTLWVPLTPVDEETAPMRYATGSHREGFADWRGDTAPEQWPVRCTSSMALGDVAVHDGWMLHASHANAGSRQREAIGLSYVPAGTRFAIRA